MKTYGKLGRMGMTAMCVVALAACAPKPRVEPSGYLGDYAGFEPADDGTRALVYVKPGLDLARYDRVIVEPVSVALAEESRGQAADPAELLRLSNYLRDALILALRGAYPVVEEPGPDVIRVRAAITDVIPTKPTLNTVGTLFLPARALSAAKRAITGTDLFVGQAAIEAEALDSQTNERLLARVDRKAGGKFRLKEGATTWGDVERAFREWAVGFRRTMDIAHGRR